MEPVSLHPMKNALRSAVALGILCVSAPEAMAQNPYASKLNVVTSAMPMLNIGPDARMGGMANAGVAASVDANALYWNPAKLAWVGQGNAMGGLAYTPWLRALVPDVELMFANAVFGVGKRGVRQARDQDGQVQPAGQVESRGARHGGDSSTAPGAMQALFPLQSVACSLFLRIFLMNRP